MDITFNVDKQIITRTDTQIIIAGSVNYVIANFTFSNDWDGLTKTAIFQREDQPYNALINENDSCVVPWEVLEHEGKLLVSVVGDGENKRITTNIVIIIVDLTGFVEGLTPVEPTPTVYETILKLLNHLRGGLTGKILRKKSNDDFDFEWITGGSGGSSSWGSIEGNLSDQIDLKQALDAKASSSDIPTDYVTSSALDDALNNQKINILTIVDDGYFDKITSDGRYAKPSNVTNAINQYDAQKKLDLEYKLIRRITLDEDVDGISINTTDDGKSFELDSIIITVFKIGTGGIVNTQMYSEIYVWGATGDTDTIKVNNSVTSNTRVFRDEITLIPGYGAHAQIARYSVTSPNLTSESEINDLLTKTNTYYNEANLKSTISRICGIRLDTSVSTGKYKSGTIIDIYGRGKIVEED